MIDDVAERLDRLEAENTRVWDAYEELNNKNKALETANTKLSGLVEKMKSSEGANTKKVVVRFDKIDKHTKQIKGYIGTLRRRSTALNYKFDDGFRLLEKRRRDNLLELREGIRDQNSRLDEIEYINDQIRQCLKEGGR